MKKFFYCLIAFLIIGSAAGGAVLFSNFSYSDNRGGDLTPPQNSITATAPENTDLWTDGHYADAFAGGSGTSTDPYQIATAAQLARLAYLINDTTTNSRYRSRYYVQTANIDLSLYYWDAIGYSESYSFRGYYDGRNYTISGVYTEAGSTNDYSYQGLFGYSYLSGRVNNVRLVDSIIQGYNNVGGICGYSNIGVSFYNCRSEATIQATGTNVGGIVGRIRGSVHECCNAGTVSGSANVGGVIGYAEICARYNCYNTGTVSGNTYVAGICGKTSGSWTNSQLNNCYNIGTISGNTYVAGICGTSSSSVYNCCNIGSVSGTNYVGGICANGSTGSLSYCYNVGPVSGTGSSVGGIIGYNSGTNEPKNCYVGGDCTIDVNAPELSSANMKDINWYLDSSNWHSNSEYKWNFTETWAIVEEQNDGYPVLRALSNLITYIRNFEPNEIISIQREPGVNEIAIADYNIFSESETGYEIIHWNTSADGSGVNFYAGNIYSTDSSLTLYAIWEPLVYTITLDWNGGVDNQSALGAMYIKYDTGIYSNSTATAGLSSLTESNLPTRAGFTLLGFYTENNTSSICLISVETDSSGERTGTFSELLTTTYFIDHATLYAQWSANNPAYYDADGDYWYVENGRMPQSRVSSSLNRTLDSRWASLNDGATYSMGAFGGLVLTTKVYQNEEYYYNETLDEYYRVEPIKWRLTSNAGQTSGYGTDEDTYAVMDTIVYYGQYSTGAINGGDGYQITPVYYLKDNYIDSTFLVRETLSMPTFGGSGSLNSTSQTFTDNIFVSSREDIIAVADTYSVKFSDLVTDLLADAGSVPLYFTRDLGTNLNHVYCLTPDGALLQYQPNRNKLGVQFTIKITEYACVG